METGRYVYMEGSQSDGKNRFCKLTVVTEEPKPMVSIHETLFGNTVFKVPERRGLKLVSG